MAEEPQQTSANLWTTGWSLLSGCFRIALMPGKVMLAALGVFAMAFGWWFLALIFSSTYGTSPEWGGTTPVAKAAAEEKKAPEAKGTAPDAKAKTNEPSPEAQLKQRWLDFKHDLARWNLMYETAGMGKPGQYYSLEDVANSPEELETLKLAGILGDQGAKPEAGAAKSEPDRSQLGRELAESFEKAVREGKLKGLGEERVSQIRNFLGKPKPAGRLNTWPWAENRGPNPLMLVSGSAGSWTNNRFVDWLIKDQGPVLIEPVLKMLRPVAYLFHPKATTGQKIYFLTVALWTILVWSIFGGAIARMAGMELARDESIPMREALQFSMKRLQSLAFAPLAPLVLMFALLVLMVVFGWLFMIPIVGDILLGGLGWIFPLLVGFGMAILLVGLLAWPLMIATVAVDSEDFVQATSRGVSYLYQRPRGIALYALKALLFGAASIFVVGFMSSLTVYLAKWSVSQTPLLEWTGRQPDFLFVHAPITFGWRDLLLDGTTVNGSPIVVDGKVDPLQLARYKDGFSWWNHTGAFLASGWLYLALLLVLGFGYSFFWSASTALYLALRQDIESFDVNEIYLDEPDAEPETVPPPAAPAAPPAPVTKPNTNGGISLSVVEPPPGGGTAGA